MASLVADYSSDSESSSSSFDSDSGEVNMKKIGKALPKPDFNTGYADGQSVFINPFTAADNAKIAILEKHVKMISTDVKYVNGKKICWNNKKKKCPFGQKCKYAHESDLQVNESKKKFEASSNEKADQPPSDFKKSTSSSKSKKRVNSDNIIVNNKKTRKT